MTHSTPPTETVTFYSFSCYDLETHQTPVALYKATRAAIAAIPGGQVLEGTAEVVHRDALGGQERCRCLATGWGDLG